MSRWGQSGLNFPGRILAQTAQGTQKPPSAKEQSDYDKKLTAMSSRLDRYVSQFEYHNSNIDVVYGAEGRSLKATGDIPSGTVLLQCTPSAQYVCSPEDTAQGNIALGMQLLGSVTQYGSTPSRMVVTTSSVLPSTAPTASKQKPQSPAAPTSHSLASCFPVAPERLYPSLEDIANGEFQDPLLLPGQTSGKLTIPMPEGLTSTQQRSILSFLQKPNSNGMQLLKRAVHIAQANSVLAHGQLSYLMPLDANDGGNVKTKKTMFVRDNVTEIATIPCMETVSPRMCVFPSFSLLNHSCAPNCTPTFYLLPHPDSLDQLTTKLSQVADADNADVRLAGSHSVCVVVAVRALRPIHAGEELTINYTALASVDGSEDLPWLTEFRNQHNQRSHGFVCRCERCVFAAKETDHGAPVCFTNTVGNNGMPADIANDIRLREALLTAAVTLSEEQTDILSTRRGKPLLAEDVSANAVDVLKKVASDPLWSMLSKRQNYCDVGNAYVDRARSALVMKNIVDKTTPFVEYDVTLDQGCVILKLDSSKKNDSITEIKSDIVFNTDVTYTGTLAHTNKYKVLLQALKVYDKCSSLLIDMADDDDDDDSTPPQADEDEEASSSASKPALNLVSTDAAGNHSTATGSRVKQQLAKAESARELILVLEAVRQMALEHVGDAHWVLMLLNVALGAAYHHAGMHAMALYVRLRSLLSITVMIGGDGSEQVQSHTPRNGKVFGVEYKKLLRFTRSAGSVHPSVAAVGDSVLESAQKVMAMAYAEQARAHADGDDAAWIDVFVEQLKALLVKHQK